MADIIDQEKTEQETGDLTSGGDVQNQEQDTEAPQQLSTSSAATMGQGGYQSAQTKDTSGQGSAAGARFRNLRKYIDRSKTDLAGQIGSNLQKQQEKVQQQVGQAQTQFQQTSEAEKARLGQAQQQYGTAQQAQDYLSQNAQALAAGDQSDWQKLYGGQVADLSLQNREDIEKGLGSISEQAQQLSTEGGRFQALQNTLGRGRQYSQGAQSLDQLLLQTKAPELQKLNELRKTAGVEAQKQFTGLAEEQQKAASDIASQAGIIQSNLQEGLGEVQKNIDTDLANALQQTQESDYYKYITGQKQFGIDEAKGIVDPSIASYGSDTDSLLSKTLYGLTPSEMDAVVSQFSTMDRPEQASDIMSAEQAAQLTALSKLAGENYDYSAGKFNLGETEGKFKEGIEDIISNKKEAIEANINPLMEAVSSSNDPFILQHPDMRAKYQAFNDQIEAIALQNPQQTSFEDVYKPLTSMMQIDDLGRLDTRGLDSSKIVGTMQNLLDEKGFNDISFTYPGKSGKIETAAGKPSMSVYNSSGLKVGTIYPGGTDWKGNPTSVEDQLNQVRENAINRGWIK